MRSGKNLKKKNLGALIRETCVHIISSVNKFTDSATRILKSKTPEYMWERCGFKRGVWNYYYVSKSEKFEPLVLPRAAFKDQL